VSINGIETVLYRVSDLEECTRYFTDFGLALVRHDAQHAHFQLPEGSNVVLRSERDASLPATRLAGTGVCETIWGVSDAASLGELVKNLSSDREVRRDADGTAHFQSDDGLAWGLRVFEKRAVLSTLDPANSPGNINRLNQQRRWLTRARPKTIQHVVFQVPDYEASWAFFRDRLNFRLSDVQRTFGIFARADGTTDHHNIYFLNANLPFAGFDGQVRFDHVNYGVDDVDEIMVGANYMERQGWPKSTWGLGRHRIASSLFMYLPCPTGGQAEYGADSDALDDNWIPRSWDPLFGFNSFITNIPPFLMDAAPWDVSYVEGYTRAQKQTRSGDH
jgi:catechol 2,3-dioxygenase-like lactoylglutathione lyase family enzyme